MDPKLAFAGIPPNLRLQLLNAFDNIVRNYREHRWEPAELNGGKLSEVAYSILQGHVDGKMPSSAKKPPNFVDACRRLEGADQTKFSRSIRIQIPRMLVALYEIRNNRGVGHVGGDVDPNAMDAKLVLESSKWVMAELVRIFHNLDTTTAANLVDALTERTVPIVWEVDGKRRILRTGLSKADETLLLLYSSQSAVSEKDLLNWTEHSNGSVYRRDVLRQLHKKRFIEYDQSAQLVYLSPTGISFVEENLPLTEKTS